MISTARSECGFSRESAEFRHRPVARPLLLPEFPFTGEDRQSVTILIGGLTWKHERLFEGVLRGAGYRCRRLPETDRSAHELGKEYCVTGLCNPVYFTVGNLVRYLRKLENAGLSQREIVQKFVYLTAACGGPCRFGLYESEFRAALNAAGYHGFRVLTFSQDHGIRASTGHGGLIFTVDLGMNAMHAFILGDLLHSVQHRLRPFEAQPGSTDRAIAAAANSIAVHFAHDRGFQLSSHFPAGVLPNPQSLWYHVPNRLAKVGLHLYGNALPRVLAGCGEQLNSVEVDWLRVRPVVHVIGEFWAQMTESDGNFRMLEFLEKEGAEVAVEPISTWILYLLHQRKSRLQYCRSDARLSPWLALLRTISARASIAARRFAFGMGEKIYLHHFARLAKALGLADYLPISQKLLAELAAPWYNTQLRGGEGHLEVAKTLYYSRRRLCHLVLALKPFGCLPSMQSDAVQACLVERFPEVSFLSIETSADGEIHAYSRVQMALSEVRAKAYAEFELALKSAHHSLEEIRSFVAANPALRHPLCSVPRQPGIVSTAANFLLHADRLMSRNPSRPVGYPVTCTRPAQARTPSVQEISS